MINYQGFEEDYFPQLYDILIRYNKNNVKLTDISQALLEINALCKQKCYIKLKCQEYQKCFECKELINLEKINDYKRLNCNHCYHYKCIQEEIKEKCGNLDFENAFILCKFCDQMLTASQIRESAPIQWLKQREQNILEEQKELFDNEIRNEMYIQAMNYQFSCNICMEQYNLNEKGITLNCSCKFCKDCLRDYAIQKINEGQFFEQSMVCPSVCKKEGSFLDPHLLKELLSGENAILYQRMLEFRSKDYERDPNIQLLKCPGYILRRQNQDQQDSSYQTLSQQQIEAFRMQNNFSIPDGFTMHECKNLFEFDPRINLKQTKCNVCNYEFCLFGCEKTHTGSCEQFKEWIRLNNAGDQEFQAMVLREKMALCPKCKSYILKNQGCNHMTCRRPNCGKEFCYVCGADHPCRNGH